MEELTPIQASENIANLNIPITEKLHLHLFSNLNAQVPMNMVAVCEKVIADANAGVPRDTLIDLPDGVWFHGEVQATIQQIIDGHRLEFFLNDYEVTSG
jgi:hypothetical protein